MQPHDQFEALYDMMQSGLPWGGTTLSFPGEGDGAHRYRCNFSLLTPPEHGQNYTLLPAAEVLALRESALLDPLTGVLNRRGLLEALSQLLSAPAPARHALVMVDIDHFKALNDRMGHPFGDRTLIAVADALRSNLRAGDILGRLGGDEFLLCLKDLPPRCVPEEKLAQLCAALHLTQNGRVYATSCLGGAICPDDGDLFDTLYPKADCALYAAKRRGPGHHALYRPE
ncbi:MAG: GGDEF domain-containing protein [Pseudoflavonifractor sp.]